MKKTLRIAVESESEQDLIRCLDFIRTKDIGFSEYGLIEKALVGRWHRQHEDLVNAIYLGGFSDDRFVEPILDIALNRETLKWYDDELESTLRKCVHALKTIDSEKSNTALKRLEELNNDNVRYALEMYK